MSFVPGVAWSIVALEMTGAEFCVLGNPGVIHVGRGHEVPLTAGEPTESAVVAVPVPSFMPHRPIRPPVADVISYPTEAWIWAGVRAVFQIRASSIDPPKNPPAMRRLKEVPNRPRSDECSGC